ncbi:hypothetical protein SLS61_006742 [Didymella pomorum]
MSTGASGGEDNVIFKSIGKTYAAYVRFNYFQVIFTAGLTVTYCISLGVLKHSPDEMQNQTEAVDTITTCGRILCFFKDRMPDAGSFAVVFDLLKEEYIAGLLGHTSQSASQIDGNGGIDPGLTQGVVAPSGGDFDGMWPSMGPDLNGFGVYTDFGLTDDLMTQLEAGLGEYAWGTMPIENNFLDQVSFD